MIGRHKMIRCYLFPVKFDPFVDLVAGITRRD